MATSDTSDNEDNQRHDTEVPTAAAPAGDASEVEEPAPTISTLCVDSNADGRDDGLYAVHKGPHDDSFAASRRKHKKAPSTVKVTQRTVRETKVLEQVVRTEYIDSTSPGVPSRVAPPVADSTVAACNWCRNRDRSDSQGEPVPVRQEVIDREPKVHREEMVVVERRPRDGATVQRPPTAQHHTDFAFVRHRGSGRLPSKSAAPVPPAPASAPSDGDATDHEDNDHEPASPSVTRRKRGHCISVCTSRSE